MMLKNKRISLRLFEESDIKNKIEWINNPENNEFLHYDIPLSYQKTLDWCRTKDNTKRIDCVIEYDGIPVGLVGLLNIDFFNKKCEFYISMGDTSFKRKGIATTSTNMILKYAFDELNLNKVYLNVDSENIIACKLYEKVGFQCEGEFKKDLYHRDRFVDRKRYAILKEEFLLQGDTMNGNNNILILSAGTRNKIVQYFKKALNGKGRVIATDMSNIAPAVYEADKFYQVPRMTEDGYIDVIFDICKKEKITGILSLIDPELSLLASHKEDFDKIGVSVIGSSYDLCERALDKMQMYRWLKENNYSCAKSYDNKEAFYSDLDEGVISFPVFVKPIRGSASIAISKVYDKETIELLFARNDNLMIQEFLEGQEIGADVYIDMLSGEVVSIFTKNKLVMRAGETDKAVSFKDEKLFALIEKFAKDSGWAGQIDIDIFNVDGKYYISEVNPRFGGGYPHAYECGCDHMKLIVNNLNGKSNVKSIGNYEENVYMMKYNEIAIRR